MTRRTAGDIFVKDAVTRADVRADAECPCHGRLASVLQKLRPLRFIKFALQGDHTLEHVSTTIDAVMVGHCDLEVGEGVFSSKGVKAQRHRGASGKRHAQEFVGVDTALAADREL